MKRNNGIIWLLVFLVWSVCARGETNKDQITVLQWNIWQEGTSVEGGYDAIVNEIFRLQPDFILFSEVRNYNNVDFVDRLCRSLEERGVHYYASRGENSAAISKHPVTESSNLCDNYIYRLVSECNGRKFAIYSAHLDYTHYACYLPRGYSGITWKECPLPQTVDEILAQNDASKRIRTIREFMAKADADLKAGYNVILGGDFNEPSWMDWKEDTKNLFDHGGFVVPWTTTRLLHENGFIDTYRRLYPNAVTHPGFTWVSDNPGKEPDKLSWAIKADERDRIDYIFYKGDQLNVTDAVVFGPKTSIVRGERVEESTGDNFLLPLSVWPSDHKGVLVTFQLNAPLGSDWMVEDESAAMQVTAVDDTLDMVVPAGLTLWYNKRLTGSYEISYDISMPMAGCPYDRLSDLNCFWAANDPQHPDDLFARKTWRNGVFGNYNTLNLFYVGYGGNNNTTTRFRYYRAKYYGVDDSQVKPLLREYTDPAHLLASNTWYHIVIRVSEGHTTYSVNGEELFRYSLAPKQGDGYFGLRLLQNHVLFTGFEVKQLCVPII